MNVELTLLFNFLEELLKRQSFISNWDDMQLTD